MTITHIVLFKVYTIMPCNGRVFQVLTLARLAVQTGLRTVERQRGIIGWQTP